MLPEPCRESLPRSFEVLFLQCPVAVKHQGVVDRIPLLL